MRPLLQGQIQPKQISLSGAFATLRRDRDGSFALSFGDAGAPVEQLEIELAEPRLLDFFFTPRPIDEVGVVVGAENGDAAVFEQLLVPARVEGLEGDDIIDFVMPELESDAGRKFLTPVEVSDVTDGKIVHLAGLDLSRAWCLQGTSLAQMDASAWSKLSPEYRNSVSSTTAAGFLTS